MMFTFKSPANEKNIWKLSFRDKDEMNKIYYENKPVDQEARLHRNNRIYNSNYLYR